LLTNKFKNSLTTVEKLEISNFIEGTKANRFKNGGFVQSNCQKLMNQIDGLKGKLSDIIDERITKLKELKKMDREFSEAFSSFKDLSKGGHRTRGVPSGTSNIANENEPRSPQLEPPLPNKELAQQNESNVPQCLEGSVIGDDDSSTCALFILSSEQKWKKLGEAPLEILIKEGHRKLSMKNEGSNDVFLDVEIPNNMPIALKDDKIRFEAQKSGQLMKFRLRFGNTQLAANCYKSINMVVPAICRLYRFC
jgi:hypothetical protein